MQKVQHIVRIQRKCGNYILLLVTWRLASQQSTEHAETICVSGFHPSSVTS